MNGRLLLPLVPLVSAEEGGGRRANICNTPHSGAGKGELLVGGQSYI